MATTHDRKIITKLNRETKEGTIKWDIIRNKPSSLSGSEVLIDNVYICKVLNKKLRLYKYQSKYFVDEERFEWTDSHRLEFMDGYGNSEWTFPADRGIYELYESVRFKASDIEQFIGDYLADEGKGEEKEEKDENPF
jgi:hypothetical protein